jgi:hypothetical protein
VKAFGWVGAASKFVGRKPQRFGGLLCCERQAVLPRANCTPRAAQERARLQKAFSMAQLSSNIYYHYKTLILLNIFHKPSITCHFNIECI